jgi:D-xylonolactonase
MRSLEPEVIADPGCQLGEGPLWHALENRLYWVDIPTGTIYRFSTGSNDMECFPTGQVIGGYTIQEDGSLLLFGAKGSIRAWHEGHITSVLEQIPGENETRFNDVIATPEGGIFCGTLSSKDHTGSLYYLTPYGEVVPVLRNVLCSNGMGFDLHRNLFYHTDSDRREISRFDYLGDGKIANRRCFAQIEENEGVPDGMTVDAEGSIWSTHWKGNCLTCYDLDGNDVLKIAFPALRVTSVTFGGKDYSELYVTTAGGDQKQNEGWGAGAIFLLRPGVSGVPEFVSRIRIPS